MAMTSCRFMTFDQQMLHCSFEVLFWQIILISANRHQAKCFGSKWSLCATALLLGSAIWGTFLHYFVMSKKNWEIVSKKRKRRNDGCGFFDTHRMSDFRSYIFFPAKKNPAHLRILTQLKSRNVSEKTRWLKKGGKHEYVYSVGNGDTYFVWFTFLILTSR